MSRLPANLPPLTHCARLPTLHPALRCPATCTWSSPAPLWATASACAPSASPPPSTTPCWTGSTPGAFAPAAPCARHTCCRCIRCSSTGRCPANRHWLPLPVVHRPEASLHSVAQRFLSDLEVESEETRKAVVSFIPAAFASVGAMARQFYAAERRCGGERKHSATCGRAAWGADASHMRMSQAGGHATALRPHVTNVTMLGATLKGPSEPIRPMLTSHSLAGTSTPPQSRSWR